VLVYFFEDVILDGRTEISLHELECDIDVSGILGPEEGENLDDVRVA
jgi:hypothetical protein